MYLLPVLPSLENKKPATFEIKIFRMPNCVSSEITTSVLTLQSRMQIPINWMENKTFCLKEHQRKSCPTIIILRQSPLCIIV